MTINDILNFVNKYNLSDEARDELITMFILNDKTKFNTTPYNPKLGPSDNILQESLILSSQGKVSSAPKKVVVSSHEYSNNDKLAGILCLKDRNIIDEKIDLMRKGYYSNKTKSKTGLTPVVWRD